MSVTYEVRCCCTPTKLLGYLALNEGQSRGIERGIPIRVLMTKTVEIPKNCDKPIQVLPDEYGYVEVTGKLLSFYDAIDREHVSYIAIYGDDRPIEEWERILNFSHAPERRLTIM